MFHTPIEPRLRISPSVAHLMAFVGKPLPFPAAMDLCREQVPAAMDCDAMRFAAQARKATSRQAFRTAFTTADWLTFSSFCIARRLPPAFRLLFPGQADRTLRFVVEGSLWQESGALTGEVHDRGLIRDPLVGRISPPGTGLGGAGVWMTNHLCDLVQIRSAPTTGTTVRVQMTLPVGGNNQ